MLYKRVFLSKILVPVFLFVGLLICILCAPGKKEPTADKIFINGHIITMDENVPEVEAFAVGEGQILEVGDTETILKGYPNLPVVDFQGKTVMPGIVESHGHLLSLGKSFLELNLEGVKTPDEAVRKVEERVRDLSPGEWLIGWGWDEGAWAADYPDNKELSRVSPENPVYLRGLHGFASWFNAKALETAGIDASTPNPDNGEVLKDPITGIPTGILTNRAQDLITEKIPPMTQDQVEKALKLAHRECLRNGLTTVHEARVTRRMLDAFRSLEEKDELDIRIYTMLDWTDEALIDSCLEIGPFIDPDFMLTIRCIKIFVDGALGSRGAAFFEPYSDAPETTGVITTPEESVYQLTKRALKSGYQVAVHAIGDLANRITLNAFKKALEDVPTEDHRLRVEHAQVVAVEDIPKYAPLGIVLSMQPPHCTSDMPWAETRIGPERIKGAYAWRSFLDTGVHLTLNSDFPGETLNPFFGMFAAETRQTTDGLPEGGWYPEQVLTRKEVLKAYTVEAAYSGFEEEFKGKIKLGMLADFIVLSDDILTIASNKLLELKVEQTYLGGDRKFNIDSE
ncbi:MAG: amidohydrolase [Candidatus Aminicenantes bacterium]